ncbi:ras-related protein Rab-18-B [Anolis carolinensis]|uniref:small monomeric GTPase n=1 Tax=Anolis carolinensis TaxID=28377 RepID=R4GC35_ANOCA|nr:PREDICTED: ras-related protein Rab-18-B [Anolis carolinensis]|eukprot:XP_003222718.1 PREDICTED: ras-related protein Rab-18-B [Anolis carolinensis]
MSQLSTPQESATSLPTLKLLLIGDSGVGKSSLLLRFTEDQFEPYRKPTIGVDFKIKKVIVGDLPLQVAIWDTAGQERFRTLTPSYYRGAQGIILVYDVTRRETFLGLESWLQELEVFTKKEVVKILVGNKIDETRHEVERREGLRFARRHSLLFAEASAKMKYGVQNIFDEVVIRILQTPGLWNIKRQGLRLTESQTLKESNSCSGLYCVVA